MYAIIETGGKQYKVTEGEVVRVEKLAGDVGSKIDFNEVLFVGSDKAPKCGTPFVDGASVATEIAEQARAPKIIVFKKKRRKGYQKKQGHRQDYTALKVVKINSN